MSRQSTVYSLQLLLGLVVVLGLGAGEALAQGGEKRVRGLVIDVQGDIATINCGETAGVRERMVFVVYQPARVIALPWTQETVYIEEKVVANLVIVAVDRVVAQAKVLPPEGAAPEAAIPEVRKNDRAISDPYTLARNVPPYFRSVAAAGGGKAEFGRSVEIKCDVTNEKEDLLYYRFAATGGLVTPDRSATPVCTWWPPAEKGKWKVTISAHDTAGNVSTKDVEVESLGPSASARNVFEPRRNLADHATGPFANVRDIAFDEQNNAFVWDERARRLVGISAEWQVSEEGRSFLTTLEFGDLSATFDRFVVRDGFAYMVDTDYRRALKLKVGAKMFQEVPAVEYGTRGVANGQFEKPVDIAVDRAGDVYVLDEQRACVQIFANDGTFLASIGMPGTGKGQLGRPVGMGLAHDGTLYVLDVGRKAALVYRERRIVSEFAVGGTADPFLDLKVDAFTGRVCVLEKQTGQIRSFDREGRPIEPRAFGSVGEWMQQWKKPERLRFDAQGFLYVIDAFQVLHRCDASSPDRQVVARWGGYDFRSSTKVASSPSGELALLNPKTQVVVTLDRRGWIKAMLGGPGETPGKFDEAVDLVADAAGNVYVLDKGKKQVQQFMADGRVGSAIGKAGSGADDLLEPIDLAIDPSRQWLAVLDERGKHNVHIYDLKGGLRAAFPGEEDYLEDASSVCIDRSGIVHVAVAKGKAFTFQVSEALKAGGGGAAIDSGNRFKQGQPWQIKDVKSCSDLEFATAFLFAVNEGDSVQILDARSQYLPSIKNPKACAEPDDVAADAYDRIYVRDADKGRVVEFGR